MNKDKILPVLGFDILPMSSTSKFGGVRVAASAIMDDGERKEWSEIDRQKLFNIINRYRIKYVGTDNPAEVVKENEDIATFCDNLPVETHLVHVNLTRSGETVPLKNLLTQYNIVPTRKKLSPIKTARALISLMEKGVGMILEPYESETIIKVGRPSSSSKGGWSQARYQRQAEEVVAREAKKIKEILRKNKIQYDEIIHSTKYGAKLARYHIFRSRTDIDDLFDGISFYPANVKIWAPKKQLITHRPLDSTYKPRSFQLYSHVQRLIVGIDPGMTTGVAILNLNGKVMSVFSRKNMSKGQLISEITKFGVPVLICADVSPVPTFVSKVAATYNAEIYAPKIQLSKEDKRFLANKKGLKKRLNSHERDALSAVIRASQKYDENFTKIEQSDLSRKLKGIAKSMLIRGLSVSDALNSVQSIDIDEEEILEDYDIEMNDPNMELMGRISNLLEKMAISEDIISNLRAHTGRLEAQNQLLQNRIDRLLKKLNKIQNEETRKVLSKDIIEQKDNQINRLKRKLELLTNKDKEKSQRIEELERMLWLTLDNGGVPVKILNKFSHDAIEDLRKERGIEDGDIILILDPTGGGPQTAENLAKNDLKFLFTEKNDMPSPAFEIFYKKGIPVRRAEKYGIIRTNYMGLINKKNLLQAQEDYIEYVEKRKKHEKTEKIFNTIENYQYERTKELMDNSANYDDYEPEEEFDNNQL